MKAVYAYGSVVVTDGSHLLEQSSASSGAGTDAISQLRLKGYGARVLSVEAVAALVTVATARCAEDASGAGNLVGGLVLLDEEALYLTSQGELQVRRLGEKDCMSVSQLWATFVSCNPHFVAKFKVYCFLKEKSYVIKSGVNFGVDYTVYRALPSQCHSEMCVTVIDSSHFPTSLCSHEDGEAPSWRHIGSLTRVMPDVLKLCLLCYVVPSGVDEQLQALPLARTTGSVEQQLGPPHDPYLNFLFPDNLPPSATSSQQQRLDMQMTLHQLVVRPVSVQIRRIQIMQSTKPRQKPSGEGIRTGNGDNENAANCDGSNYESIRSIQRNYLALSGEKMQKHLKKSYSETAEIRKKKRHRAHSNSRSRSDDRLGESAEEVGAPSSSSEANHSLSRSTKVRKSDGSVTSRSKKREQREHLEVRKKEVSKANKFWTSLMSIGSDTAVPSTSDITATVLMNDEVQQLKRPRNSDSTPSQSIPMEEHSEMEADLVDDAADCAAKIDGEASESCMIS